MPNQPGGQMVGRQITPEMQKCIRDCQDCHAVCLQTMQYCLQMGGRHAEATHIALLRDCAEICQTAADFMISGSDLYKQTCGICAEVCTRCAQDCESFGDDQTMKQCAEVCRRCAQSCQRMASGA